MVRHFDAGLPAGVVEEAEDDPFGHLRTEGEIGAPAVVNGAQGVGLAG
jgi:hypothetical protein